MLRSLLCLLSFTGDTVCRHCLSCIHCLSFCIVIWAYYSTPRTFFLFCRHSITVVDISSSAPACFFINNYRHFLKFSTVLYKLLLHSHSNLDLNMFSCLSNSDLLFLFFNSHSFFHYYFDSAIIQESHRLS